MSPNVRKKRTYDDLDYARMLIKQLSIFLGNKKGRFTEVAKILCEAGVNMSAFTGAENSDFGILRLIVSDTDTAVSYTHLDVYKRQVYG